MGEGKDGFTQGKGERRADFQNGEVVADQRTISLAGLVVGRVRFVDHRGAFDPGGERFRFLRLVMNDLRMVELHAGLHDDGDNSLQRGVEPQLTEGGFMGFERRGGILRPGDMYAADGAGLAAGNRNFGPDDVGQVALLLIAGGLFGSLTQASGALSNHTRSSGTGSSAQDIDASRWILLKPAAT